MKNLAKYTAILALSSSVALTGCIEEVQPTSSVSQEQLESSVKAGEAMIMAMPAMMINCSYPNFKPNSRCVKPRNVRILFIRSPNTIVMCPF